MVDPVVRAKLADWLLRAVGGDTSESLDWDTAYDHADALLGLPPSVRAQLLGIGLEEERFGTVAHRFVTPWRADLPNNGHDDV